MLFASVPFSYWPVFQLSSFPMVSLVSLVGSFPMQMQWPLGNGLQLCPSMGCLPTARRPSGLEQITSELHKCLGVIDLRRAL